MSRDSESANGADEKKKLQNISYKPHSRRKWGMDMEGQFVECRNLSIVTDLWNTNWKSGSQKPNTLGFIILWKRPGRDRSVCIATRYWLDSLGFKSWWGEISHTLQDQPLSSSTSCTMGTGSLFRGVKRTGRGVHHPPSF
jgi:hypothetical protein